MQLLNEVSSTDVRLSFDPLWFDAPPERSRQFFPTFLRISRTLQNSLRRMLAEQYLADLEHFRDSRFVYPLLVYVASRPFCARARTDLTYDILNEKHMHTFQYWVRLTLPAVLEQVHARLQTAGMEDVAKRYRADKSPEIADAVLRLKICRRRLHALLKTDTLLLNELVAFAGSRRLSARGRSQIEANCRKAWLSKLRRLWPKKDYAVLGQQLLDGCTEALRRAIVPAGNSLERRPVGDMVKLIPQPSESQSSSFEEVPPGLPFAEQTTC